MEQHAKVIITEEGRSGSVTYAEQGRSLSGWWEFAGGDAIAIVCMGGAEDWKTRHAWAADRRSDILRHIADAVIRQKAGGCSAEIEEEGGWITFRR
jgi:hypothetical protein